MAYQEHKGQQVRGIGEHWNRATRGPWSSQCGCEEGCESASVRAHMEEPESVCAWGEEGEASLPPSLAWGRCPPSQLGAGLGGCRSVLVRRREVARAEAGFCGCACVLWPSSPRSVCSGVAKEPSTLRPWSGRDSCRGRQAGWGGQRRPHAPGRPRHCPVQVPHYWPAVKWQSEVLKQAEEGP